jgi:Ser/Thr protein kinase RdoA (MazF antagonist)
VVKLFGPLFEGGDCFEVERGVAGLLSAYPQLPAPRVLAEGRLLPGDPDWDWPYLIFEYRPGVGIGAAWAGLGEAARRAVAAEMGGWLRLLHGLEAPGDFLLQAGREDFTAFLAGQHANCAALAQGWGSLPAHLVEQVQDFLPALPELIPPDLPLGLIHADLTGDHLLGRVEGGRWRSTGWIDFGDARRGNLYYELAALHLDLFAGDRGALAECLRAYGFCPPANFPRLALSYCLLHQFNVFASAACQGLEWRAIRTLEELAENLWGI